MKEMDIDYIQKIIRKIILRIKELQNENRELRAELQREKNKKGKVIEEIIKLENEIKERT